MEVKRPVSIELAKIYAEFLQYVFLLRSMLEVSEKEGEQVRSYLRDQHNELQQRASALNIPKEPDVAVLSRKWWRDNGFPLWENIVP